MPRVKRSVPARRRHKKILNLAKGFRMTHRTLFRPGQGRDEPSERHSAAAARSPAASNVDESGAPGGVVDLKEGVLSDIDELAKQAEARIMAASDLTSLEQLRVQLLGKKGEVTSLLRGVGQLPPEQRSSSGAKANQLKEDIMVWLAMKAARLQLNREATLGETEWVDLTFVPNPVRRGHLHPLTLILREVKAIFSRLGYEVALGPQVEDEVHNFEALNIPQDHPARDTMEIGRASCRERG